ncbi:MAG: acetate/propionate family kinase [Anderseniella sp.]
MKNFLVLNAGSSSLKFAVFAGDDLEVVVHGQVDGLGSIPAFAAKWPDGTVHPGAAPVLPHDAGHAKALDAVLGWLCDNGNGPDTLAGSGHRIVHGGDIYTGPVIVDDLVLANLDDLRSKAPLHLPFGISALRRMRQLAPDLPQVACFDTAFHADQPDTEVRLPIPQKFHDKGYHRYGFHGLNYEHVVAALPDLSGKPLPKRLLIAHLGSGASMVAVRDGVGVATTMGYSTADGLVMSTRSGALDPGVLIALMRDEGLGLNELEDLLYRQSGLLGLSGISGDMRELLASDSARAQAAVDYYCYWAARHAGSLITALGGIDGLVFTAGVGENAAPVRAGIVNHLNWLGVELENQRNVASEMEISPPGTPCQVWIIKANEELAIAHHVRSTLKG